MAVPMHSPPRPRGGGLGPPTHALRDSYGNAVRYTAPIPMPTPAAPPAGEPWAAAALAAPWGGPSMGGGAADPAAREVAHSGGHQQPLQDGSARGSPPGATAGSAQRRVPHLRSARQQHDMEELLSRLWTMNPGTAEAAPPPAAAPSAPQSHASGWRGRGSSASGRAASPHGGAHAFAAAAARPPLSPPTPAGQGQVDWDSDNAMPMQIGGGWPQRASTPQQRPSRPPQQQVPPQPTDPPEQSQPSRPPSVSTPGMQPAQGDAEGAPPPQPPAAGGDGEGPAPAPAAAAEGADGTAGSPLRLAVYERNEVWRQGKEGNLDALRRARRAAEEAACTFRPRINEGPEDAHKRVAGGNVVDRLRQQGRTRRVSVEEMRRARDRQELEYCSFRPHLNRKPWTDSVAPRYLDPATTPRRRSRRSARRSRSAQRPGARGAESLEGDEDDWSDSAPEGCTFQPRINSRFRPNAARGYLETDAFERLSKPGTPSRPVKHSDRWRTPGASEHSDANRSINQRDLGCFFLRLQEQQDRQQERLEELREAYRCRHSPRINSRSRSLVEARGGADFWHRLHSDQQRRQMREEGAGAARGQSAERPQGASSQARLFSAPGTDCDFSFRPRITERATQMPPRSTVELSLGDHQRRAERLEQRQAQRQQREDADCPFTPNVNREANAPCRISIATNLAGYQEWHRQRAEVREKQMELERRAKQAEQEAQCTFKPEIHEAPAYIRTIAASVNLAKSPAARERPQHPCHTFGYAQRNAFDGRVR
eukprot:TRINITY_DN5880_c0_g1_i1.p1 TRINITY_DN5880_c0_g1~~TRINITY_DN5880_c0_g1_i1.p1  ORF type:complete len:767 (+),score=193.63 TRINITY_DN5880_c0_g1_i1:70-2370(+)